MARATLVPNRATKCGGCLALALICLFESTELSAARPITVTSSLKIDQCVHTAAQTGAYTSSAARHASKQCINVLLITSLMPLSRYSAAWLAPSYACAEVHLWAL